RGSILWRLEGHTGRCSMSHDCLELDQILIEEYEAMYGSLPEAVAAPQTKPGPQQNLDAKEGAGPTDPERIKSAKLARVIKRLHAGKVRAALCLSGGGVRSATF